MQRKLKMNHPVVLQKNSTTSTRITTRRNQPEQYSSGHFQQRRRKTTDMIFHSQVKKIVGKFWNIHSLSHRRITTLREIQFAQDGLHPTNSLQEKLLSNDASSNIVEFLITKISRGSLIRIRFKWTYLATWRKI